MDDVTLGKLLTEAHRGQADYCGPEGVSVSQSSSSVVFDGSGKPDERDSSSAQIRTLLEEQRQMIIAEYREKVSHHELHAAHAEEERRLLREELWRQKLEFREVHQQSLTEMEELWKFQISTPDTIARRKLIEDQKTILELSGRVQEQQNEVNCMNDSKDFRMLNAFAHTSWMCKKQTAVSHSSTESEVISLDTGLRLDGLPALELWDLIVSVFGSVSLISYRTGRPVDVHKHHKPHKKIDVIENIDSVPSNVQSSRQEALMYVFEDNEAVIKMIVKGRSPTMRHVSKTHRVALDWLFDRINLDPKIQFKYIDTKKPTRRHSNQRKFYT